MGDVVAFMPAVERLKVVRCKAGHEYADLDAALDLDCGSVPLCRECGEPLDDCVFDPDGQRRLPAVSS